MNDRIDAVTFAPHPDDAELGCSGTLLRLKQTGKSIAIVDLTEGELSTRGTRKTRMEETNASSKILGLDVRVNLQLPDGNLANTMEHRLKIISIIRQLRPHVVFLPYPRDRHPDHEHASGLLKDAVFYSGLEKIPTEFDGHAQTAHRPALSFYYMLSTDFVPAFVVDVSETFDKKLQAIRAYGTQFFSGDMDAAYPETYISGAGYMEALIARARRLGFSIGSTYGEGFTPLQPLALPPEIFFT